MKQFVTLLLAGTCLTWANAQDVRTRQGSGTQTAQPEARRISGRVLGTNGEPLVGATIQVVNRSTGAVITGTYTDGSGNYTVSVPDPSVATVRISYVNYATRELPANGGDASFNITLAETEQTLNEVVVTGYRDVSRDQFVGSASTVSGQDFQNIPLPSVDRLLQGRAAGLNVIGNTGIPGGNTTVNIRGIGSISGGTQPLYVVDGVQMNGFDRSRGLSSSNPLNGINPNDIESVTVLKDAAAAAVYGSNAANGVIVITTKRGSAGKTQVTFDASYGFIEAIRDPNEFVMNSQDWAFWTWTANGRTTDYPTFLNTNFGVTDPAQLPYYNWAEEVYQTGAFQNYAVSLNGGNEKTRFFLSTNFQSNTSQLIQTNFQRTQVRANLDHRISDKFRVFLNTNMSSVWQTTPAAAGGAAAGSIIISNLQVVGPMILPTNNGRNPTTGQELTTIGFFQNPRLFRQLNRRSGVTNQLLGSIGFDFEIIEGLKWTSRANLEFTSITEGIYTHPRFAAAQNGVRSAAYTEVRNLQTDQLLEYSKVFGDHNIYVQAGFNYRNEQVYGITATGNGVSDPQLIYLPFVTPATASEFLAPYKVAGVFGTIQYSFKDRYNIQATVRNDASSRFGRGNQSGTFPAVGFSWIASKEEFFSGLTDVVNNLRIRGSWGQTGNQLIGNFASRSLFGAGGAYNGSAGLTVSQFGNSSLSWEVNEQYDAGFDIGLYNDRINLSATGYYATRKDLLYPTQLSSLTGVTSITSNVGEIVNRGIELELTAVPVRLANGFEWRVTANHSIQSNKISKLPGGDVPAQGLFIGQAISQQFQAVSAGVNAADGRPMWYDANGNITYFPTAADRRMLGSTAQPRYFGGFTNDFSYKGLSLSVFWQYSVGLITENTVRAVTEGPYFGSFATNFWSSTSRAWTAPGQVTDVPRLTNGSKLPGASDAYDGSGTAGSNRFVESLSYLRLKNVALSYEIPVKNFNWTFLSSIRVYVQAANLLTFTRYTGPDPEIVNAVAGIGAGTDNGVFPQGRTYTGGIQVTF